MSKKYLALFRINALAISLVMFGCSAVMRTDGLVVPSSDAFKLPHSVYTMRLPLRSDGVYFSGRPFANLSSKEFIRILPEGRAIWGLTDVNGQMRTVDVNYLATCGRYYSPDGESVLFEWFSADRNARRFVFWDCILRDNEIRVVNSYWRDAPTTVTGSKGTTWYFTHMNLPPIVSDW